MWLEGFFPKQLVYFLLLKGLVDSPSEFYGGRTKDPRLSINVLNFNGSVIVDVDPSDPKPAGKNSPCLRITDPSKRNEPRWVHESSSISLLLGELYVEKTAIISPTPLKRAAMDDIHATILQSITDANYYIKNAAAVTTSWPDIRDEEDGWLTPGLDHPGSVDAVLSGGARYMELIYSLDLFEDERLGLLREWYSRFKKVS